MKSKINDIKISKAVLGKEEMSTAKYKKELSDSH